MTDSHGLEEHYRYDALRKLIRIKDTLGITTVKRDTNSRPSEKHLPGGMITRFLYDGKGQLTQLLHEDEDGILDHYAYTYDRMGNKTGITGHRRGLEEESGSYGYAYDALGRLSAVTKDGKTLRDYTYDSFGNRIEMKDHHTGRKTACTYDALNRLVGMKDSMTGPAGTDMTAGYAYTYDNRGNLIQQTKDGMVIHEYAYGAAGRLVSATDRLNQREAAYAYNGLGQRTSRIVRSLTDTSFMAHRPGKDTEIETAWEEDYLLDLTKPYHNLLGLQKNGTRQTFYYDNNVTAMEENGHFHYYLLDELGSPLRVSDWGTSERGAADSQNYLTYGYDEFGNDPGKELEQAGIPNPYSRQGEDQPFGYTGYRYDDISSTYFAQAREYQPKTGRFTAEDKIKGYFTVPESLNQYSYCKNKPLILIDKSGLNGYYFYDPEMYSGVNSEGEEIGVDIEKIKEMDIAYLEKKYNTTIHPIAMDPSTNPDYTTFEQAWADMDDSQEEIEVVVIVTHANDNHFVTDSKLDDNNIRRTEASINREGIGNLECKDIATLYLFGCNMGLTDRTDKDNNSLASEFYASEHNIDEIIAADGSIVHGYKGSQRILYVQPGQYHKEKIPEGFKRYTYKEGKLQTEIIDIGTIWEGLYDKEYDNSEDLCTEKKQKSKK